MRVFEYLRNGVRWCLAIDEAEAKSYIGIGGEPFYTIRPIEIDVIFVVDSGGLDEPSYQDRAFKTLEGARQACQEGESILVWELLP